MLQGSGDPEQVPGLEGRADPARDLVRQCRAECLLLLELHVAAGYGAQGDQREADQQAHAGGRQCQLLAQTDVFEAVFQAGGMLLRSNYAPV